MTRQEAQAYLKKHPGYTFREGDHEGENGLFVENENWGARLFINDHGLTQVEDGAHLCRIVCQGKRVEQITRTTGYMSKVAAWNPGKKEELLHRHRTPVV